MYNPIVGIYELKRFMGLRDLPKSDHRIARVLRYFNNKDEERMINADVTPIKFWENFWCTYSDCVFVDLNEHNHNHTLFFNLRYDRFQTSTLKVDLTYKLKVNNPLKIVEDQITDTNSYMKVSLEKLIRKFVGDGALMDLSQIEMNLRRGIATSGSISGLFDVNDLVMTISYEDGWDSVHNNFKNVGSKLSNDMNTLLEIAKSSDLDAKEEEDLKNLLFNGPE